MAVARTANAALCWVEVVVALCPVFCFTSEKYPFPLLLPKYHTHNTSDTRCMSLFPHQPVLWPAGYPTVQFSPDLMDWMEPTRLLCLWNSPGEIARAGCISSSRGSSPPRDWTWVSCTVGRFFPAWATREAHLRGISINSHTLRAWSHRLTLLQTPIASSSMSLVFLTNWL